MAITTHVLDTSRGLPAAGIAVRLERLAGEAWTTVGSATTDADGRTRALLEGEAPAGTYRLRFEVAPYFAGVRGGTFFPVIEITFAVTAGAGHHHVPLLLSPFGYSTYRGS